MHKFSSDIIFLPATVFFTVFVLIGCMPGDKNLLFNKEDGLTYRYVNQGEYLMGCVPGDTLCDSIENGQHKVVIPKGFYISTTEVTVAAFRKFIQATEYEPDCTKQNRGRMYADILKDWQWLDGLNWEHPFDKNVKAQEDYPVVQVSFADAMAYCRWIGGRLATEEEWEYAARGGLVNKKYPWGNEWPPVRVSKPLANTADKATLQLFPSMEGISSYDDGFDKVAPVASFPGNGFGLYDMAGNVWEWTATRFYSGYDKIIDSVNTKYDTRIVRGGAWCYYPRQMRCSNRGYFEKDNFWTGSLGFRCVIDISKQ